MISSRQYGKALALLERYWRTYGALPGIRQFWPYFSHKGERMATTKSKKQKPVVTPRIIKQIDQLTAELATAQAATEALSPCATWAVVKPYWSLIVRIVGIIPVVGKKIGQALTTIGATLDQLCPPVVP